MTLKRFPATVFLAVLALLLTACIHTGRPTMDALRSTRITVNEGYAVLAIRGQLNQNLYTTVFWGQQDFDQQVARSGTVTRNETKRLSAGEDIPFWLVPSEAVSVNIVSADGNDVEVVIRPARGPDITHALSGQNRIGIMVSF